MVLIFIATDIVDNECLLDDNKFFKTYITVDKDGFWGVESCFFEDTNLSTLLDFIFQKQISIDHICITNNRQLIELSKYKNNCINFEQLEEQYPQWIELTQRDNTMDEYGTILGIIGYINRNQHKKHLILKVE
ncbi:MAG: hypothetical protein LBV75_09035 [Paludibacter sp.]|jgi:hypothetical protein|nr:hypothetical protein [Paludibacter sp.]